MPLFYCQNVKEVGQALNKLVSWSLDFASQTIFMSIA